MGEVSGLRSHGCLGLNVQMLFRRHGGMQVWIGMGWLLVGRILWPRVHQ